MKHPLEAIAEEATAACKEISASLKKSKDDLHKVGDWYHVATGKDMESLDLDQLLNKKYTTPVIIGRMY